MPPQAQTARPDLVMSAASSTATTVSVGGSVGVTTTVRNQGTAAATGFFYVGVYLSADATITSADTLLGRRHVAGLAVGAASTVTATVSTPATLAPGTYYLGAMADELNSQTESDETNNTLAGSPLAVVQDVDLMLSAVSTTASSFPLGGTLPFTTTARNQSATGTARRFHIGLYLSADATITPDDFLLATRYVASLAPGASSTATTSSTIPSTLAPGTYYVGAIADYTNVQSEISETNNTLAGATVGVVREVDLSVLALHHTATVVPGGGSFPVTVTLRNQGASPSGAFGVGLYLSPDTVITPFDSILISPQPRLGPLAAGTSTTVTFTAAVHPAWPSGTYYVGALVDPNNEQQETSETNNAGTGPTLLVVQDVDLVMTAVNTPTTTVPAGKSVTITDTVKNQGTSTAIGFAVGLYLSTDPIMTTADTLLAGRSGLSLAPGASSTGTTTVTVPSTLQAGTYYLGAIADYGNARAESNESNNTITGPSVVFGGPDLLPTAISTPTTLVLAGGSVTVTDTVKNQGNVATTSAFSVGLYLSTDGFITTTDTLLSSRAVATLAAGVSTTASTLVTVPATLAAGTYFLGALADTSHAQGESDETNNTLSGAALVVVRPGVDLVPTALSAPVTEPVIGGSSVFVTATVQNQGAAATTRPFSVGVYLSPDRTITTADTLLDSQTVASLAAGASSSITAFVVIPRTLVVGTYSIGVLADVSNAETETNETNNSYANPAVSFQPAPQLDEVWPGYGLFGTEVTLSGAHFGAVQGNSVVRFENSVAVPSSWSDTAITVSVPMLSNTNTTTPLVVVRVGGVDSDNTSFILTAALTGTVARAGDGMALSGARVEALQAGTVKAATTTDSNGTYHLSPLITGVAGSTYDLRVSSPGYTTALRSGILVGLGSTVVVNTTMGAPATGNPIAYAYDALGRLVGVIDPASDAAAYRYDAVGNLLAITRRPATQAAILAFAPNRGAVGSLVTIVGTGFSPTASQNTVTFNGVHATVTAATATRLETSVPAGATTGPLAVTAPSGTATSTTVFTIAP